MQIAIIAFDNFTDLDLILHWDTASSCLAGQYLSQWMIESLVGADVAKKVMTTVAPL